MVGSQQQALLHAPANNDNSSKMAEDRRAVTFKKDIKAYNNAQRFVTKAKWCMVGAALLTVFVAIDADTLSTWVVTATSVLMTASLWQAGNTVWSLYELAKIQREHIDTLERIIQKGITG